MITVSTAWKNSAQLSKKSVALVRLYYGDETSYIAIASGSIQGFDKEYRPMLLSSPVSTSGVDMFTHKFQASDITLKISNGDYHSGVKFSDLVNTIGSGNDVGFENRQCEIRLWTKGMTTWSECVQFFNGVVREITHSSTEITFSVQDKREIIHKIIDHTLLDADAADTDEGLPEKTRGRTRPVIHGEHTFLKGNNSKASDTTSTINNMVPMVYLGVDSSNNHRWFVADHKIDSINTEGDDSEQQEVWGFDSEINRFVRLQTTFTVEQNTSSGTIISHANDPSFYDHWYGKGTPTLTKSRTPQATDFSGSGLAALDKSFATSTDGSLNEGAQSGFTDFVKIVIPFPEYDHQGLTDATITQVLIAVYSNITYAGAADDTYINLFVMGNAADVKPSSGSYPDLRYFEDQVTSSDKTGIAEDVEMEMQCAISMVNPDKATWKIFEVYKRIKYVPQKLLPLYFAGRGHEYNDSTTWITSRTQTETHADNNGGGNLIENLAGNIESLYRDELDRVDADIDLDSFNVASNDNTDVFAFSINKITESLPFITKLSQDGRSFVWLEPGGLVRMKVLEDEYTASDVSLDFKTLFNPRVSRTSPKRIYTAVKVLYPWDGSRHGSETAIAEDTVYQTKYNLTEAESTLIYEAENIRNDTTATNLRSYLLAQWKQPHNQLAFGVGIEYIELDIGDILEFRNMPFKIFGEDITDNTVTRPSGQQVINKYWWIFNVKRSIQGATIKAFQLHKLD